MTRQSAAKKKPARRGPKSAYEIQTWMGSGPQPFFARLVSSRNGQTISTSEGYASKANRSKTWKPLAELLKCEIVEVDAPAAPAPSTAPASESVPSESQG